MPPSLRQLVLEATRRARAGDLHGLVDVARRAMHREGPLPSQIVAGPGQSGEPAPVRPVGAEAAGETGRFIAGRFGGGLAARDYKLFVPPAAWSRPLPLVVLLHGCKQDPDDFARGTGMNEAAADAADPCFVLYPAQPRNANVAKCWNWFRPTDQVRDGGEAGIVAAMVRHVLDRYPVDRARVWVAGLSAGGSMAAILGDAYPDLFAAAGVHSGLPTGAAKDATSAFAAMKHGGPAPGGPHPDAAPVIVFQGDRDATVHPVNGEHVIRARVGDAAPDEEASGVDGRAWTRRRWHDAGGRIVAEQWIVHGGGHAWSGGKPPGSFVEPAGPYATAAMLAFFRAHALAGAAADGSVPA